MFRRLSPRPMIGSFLFFFQAEDGIRDKLVTGVQTCALPILGEVGGGLGGCAGRRGAHARDHEEQPPPTSTNLPQPPARPHLNTIHNTPIVAASTTESTMLSWRGPAGTGTAVISGAPFVRPTVRAAPGGAVIRLPA